MSVVARTVPSVPARTSVGTWNSVIDLLTAPDHAARVSLASITSIVATLIAEEYTREAPIVIKPATGDRVRIYTAHGASAIETDEPQPLATWPLTEPGWAVSLPCGVDDIDQIRALLKHYPFADVRDLVEGITAELATPVSPSVTGALTINYDELERP
jgi:hypothetical protein